MAEIHSNSSSDRHQQGDVLLATKTAIPGLRPDLLPRPRLLERLEEASSRELILVSTPPGFGKTTLLASWARRIEKPVAWLSLEDEDNDPVRFWRYVVEAIGRVDKRVSERILPLFDIAAQATPLAVATALVNEYAAHPAGELVLVLDDYHLINNPGIHESLGFLLEHQPSGMLVVISSRSDPPLPLGRMRARGQLAELRAADLRFTEDEAIDLLLRSWKLELTEESIIVLEERTEGWVSGLQLAALSLKRSSNPEDLIQGFTGSNRFVLDYLSGEVLEQQTEEVRSFLLETSILEQLSSSLCDAITGRKDGQEMLEMLERANLFLAPLDDRRRWYRYHHLFAGLLRARLKSNQPEMLPELHRKAAAWYEDHNLADEALHHALAAGEADWAARLVEQHVEEVLQRGEGETLRGWLAALPSQVVHTRPRLALAQVIAAFNAGHLPQAEPLLEDAERAFFTAPDEPYEPSVGKEMSMLVNVPATIALLRAAMATLRGEPERTVELVRQAQSQLADGERGPLVSVHWNLAQADWMRGRLGETEAAFTDIVAEGRESGQRHLVLTASSMLGRILQAQGRLDAALHIYQESLAFAAPGGSSVMPSTAVAHLGIARVLYEHNQLEQALIHAREAISLGGQLTATQTLADGLALLAWILQAGGDQTGAWEAIEEANRVMPNSRIVALLNPVPVERARLRLIQGQAKEAAHWAETRGLRGDDEISFAREEEFLVLARILIRQNKLDQSLALLERLEAEAEKQARIGSLIEIWALQALAFRAAGKTIGAMEALAQALMQAEPQGYMRLFIDEGRPMAALLHEALARGVTADYAAKLLAAFPMADQESALSAREQSLSLATPLSERELEVLHLLARGASNQEIADELTIALSTARKHVSNIISKLGVKNRTQAVSRGRDLGLL